MMKGPAPAARQRPGLWERCGRHVVVMGGPSRFLRKAAAKRGVGGGRAVGLDAHPPAWTWAPEFQPSRTHAKEALGARRQMHLRQRVQAHEENAPRLELPLPLTAVRSFLH